jgi:hypothetical protein
VCRAKNLHDEVRGARRGAIDGRIRPAPPCRLHDAVSIA